MLDAVFQRRVRFGKADLHDRLSVQIAVRILDLFKEVPQTFLTACRRIQLHAAALDKCASVNGSWINGSHCININHFEHLLML